MPYRAHWIALLAVTAGGLAVIGAYAPRIQAAAPPIPERVVAPGGRVVLTGDDIRRGQNVWQSIGGEEVGSVWGHGAYVAPDWSADWLHRESTFVLDRWAKGEGVSGYDALGSERQAALRERLKERMRTNTYDDANGTVTLDAERAAAFPALAAHYAQVFRDGQDAYAIPKGALGDPAKLRALAAFFWWTSWSAGTNRPGQDVTYTQNWPHEPLIGNVPTGGALVWSVLSFVLLLAGIGALVWYQSGRRSWTRCAGCASRATRSSRSARSSSAGSSSASPRAGRSSGAAAASRRDRRRCTPAASRCPAACARGRSGGRSRGVSSWRARTASARSPRRGGAAPRAAASTGRGAARGRGARGRPGRCAACAPPAPAR
jgi:nitric oxide reductase large subunit